MMSSATRKLMAVTRTITETHRQAQNQAFALTVEELEAFIAVTMRGSDRKK